MRTFIQQSKKILATIAVIAVFSALNPVFAETADTKGAVAEHAHKSMDWPGVYQGFTPCADCLRSSRQPPCRLRKLSRLRPS